MSTNTHFDKAAATYTASATWQQRLFTDLLNKCPKNDTHTILDLGCGVGEQAFQLATRYPKATLVGLDQSKEMLTHAKKNDTTNRITWVQADFLNIPAQSYDLIVCNAALHWSHDPKSVIRTCKNHLHPNKPFLYAIFLPETFYELQECINTVSPSSPPLPSASFLPAKQYASYLDTYFSTTTYHVFRSRCLFDNLKALLLHIKQTGIKGTGKSQFWTPSLYKKIEDYYRNRYGGIWASFSVLIGEAYA